MIKHSLILSIKIFFNRRAREQLSFITSSRQKDLPETLTFDVKCAKILFSRNNNFNLLFPRILVEWQLDKDLSFATCNLFFIIKSNRPISIYLTDHNKNRYDNDFSDLYIESCFLPIEQDNDLC